MTKNIYQSPKSNLQDSIDFTGMEKLFRTLVISTTLLYVFFWFLPYIDHYWLNEDELDLASWDAAGSIVPQSLIINLIWFSIWVTTGIGLYFYRPAARTIFLFLMPISTVYSAFCGFLVLPPISAAIIGLVNMLDGAVLAVAYLTGVGKRFESNI